jgi:hypothetical protein
MVKLLVEAGANVNAKVLHRDSPSHRFDNENVVVDEHHRSVLVCSAENSR